MSVSWYKHYIKRCLDFGTALVLLICFFPVILVVTIGLYFANRGAGVFFTQERPGKEGKIFRIIKFKTMTDEKDDNGKLLPDGQRQTKAGKFVRSLSLDELPQLINVLKGEMSLIGPRPLLKEYLWVFDDFQMRRHEVRPGISGWAQVHGRNLCKLSKKFEMDVWYVDHCTFATDLKIIWLTIKNVLKRSDVGDGASDMEVVDDLHFTERIREIRKVRKEK